MTDPDLHNIDQHLGLTRAKAPRPDSRRDKWGRWVDGIREDLFALWVNRLAWRQMSDAWRRREPPLPPSLFFEYFHRTYADTQVAGVRRHVDTHAGAAGLCQLLREIAQYPECLSRDFYVSRYQWGSQHLGHSEFEQFDPNGLGHVDGAIAIADRDELIAVAAPIWEWANKRVAHLDPRDSKDVPLFTDLDGALNLIDEKFRRWNLILTGIDQQDPVVVYDWLAPLREPWILDNETPESSA